MESSTTYEAAQKLANALSDAGVSAENARATDVGGWIEIGTFAGAAINDEIVNRTIELLVERERNTAAPELTKSHGG
jgi:hypothetical protein